MMEKDNISVHDVQWAKGEPLGIDAFRSPAVAFPGGSPYLIFYLLAWPMPSAVWVNVWGLHVKTSTWIFFKSCFKIIF